MNTLFKNPVILGLGALGLIIVTYMFFSQPSLPNKTDSPDRDNTAYARAYVAGGCFWCVEADMEKLGGVISALSGYAGGSQGNPTYQNHGDHREAVEVVYDPSVVSFMEVVAHFMVHHDATDSSGSFHDRGHSYTSAVHYQNDEEKDVIDMVIMNLEKAMVFDAPIVTAVEPFIDFTDAEEYHQDYYKKNPVRYKGYRFASGRTSFVNKVVAKYETQNADTSKPEEEDRNEVGQETTKTESNWSEYSKPSDEEIKSQLSDIQYQVTQHEGTERPFSPGNHDEEKRAGIFVDVLSGEPLYSSRDKFDSGTGWPSFVKPIDEEFIVEKTDYKLVWPRTEIRSRYADNHIGHVFSDGPKDQGGLRYCMNGAALRFIPLEDMEQKGYADYIQYVQ